MIYEFSYTTVGIFFAFVLVTIGISFWMGRKANSSAGFFTAHGEIPWAVNGIAFAGDYLSAASFLGICGMIAAYGYDGFLYSIGYLAGWIVALFVIAEPMKRMGKFTFADALDARFNSPGIKLAAGISTLAVSVFYLIPQMVGAGTLIQPLMGLPYWAGVVMVGAVVIVIVITAGMVSTTWVQFLKGSLLVIFSLVLTVMVLQRGLNVSDGGTDGYALQQLGPFDAEALAGKEIDGRAILPDEDGWKEESLVRLQDADGGYTVYDKIAEEGKILLREAQSVSKRDGNTFIGGLPLGEGEGERVLHPVGHVTKLPDGQTETGPLGPIEFFKTLQDSEVVLWGNRVVRHADGTTTEVYFQKPTAGSRIMRPGEHPKFAGIRGEASDDSGKLVRDRINFLSLMLALFCGTASLPHILIRYYTVKDGAAARKSTIVGIASIGFFYVLTLYLGLGAMTSGALDVQSNNMAAPLLAQSLSQLLFAIISAIAFTTVLGTVSGLILASSGAVAHDLLGGYLGWKMTDHQQVRIAKMAAVVVGAIAIVLGILFQKMNVSYLVGWAFSVAASANLPALVMLLFWKRTTRQGVISSVIVGMVSSLGWILLSSDTYKQVYGWDPELAWAPFTQPGIVTIPLAFLTLIVVSLLTSPEPPVSDSGLAATGE
ncbi:Cation/acetate symporter ActP [Roseimaritima multifibrata]|uniref:Cation/acetate symporter ActP n=1 Tax=Roseimaritima multifibrata TaxID=1930274 RepID=A0A517MDW8_9BACT|nr:cation acetate symporter [Roseimaritima multifibrata]QDS93078.1 Cation/acetate symporter ActP [Roseimaritima multifibrata]